jgi:hypothetical protein
MGSNPMVSLLKLPSKILQLDMLSFFLSLPRLSYMTSLATKKNFFSFIIYQAPSYFDVKDFLKDHVTNVDDLLTQEFLHFFPLLVKHRIAVYIHNPQ